MLRKATFGAGCFWSVELVFQRLPGVVSTSVGFSGGHLKKPTYKDVCRGDTGHAEVVHISYDPKKVDYNKLLETFWKKHDPTTADRQGNDVGSQYRSVIFYHDEEQHQQALKSKEMEQVKYESPIVTQVVPFEEYYEAEEYHQKYLEKGGQCSRKMCNDPIRCYG